MWTSTETHEVVVLLSSVECQEGTAERAAWHHPYLLLFNNRFVVIRHVEVDCLESSGPSHIPKRYVPYLGRPRIEQLSSPRPSKGPFCQEPRVHGVVYIGVLNLAGEG